MTSANDNNIVQCWLDFQEDRPVFDWAISKMPDFTMSIRKCGHHKNRLSHEREAHNFIWFIRFKKSFHDDNIRKKRDEIRIVQ